MVGVAEAAVPGSGTVIDGGLAGYNRSVLYMYLSPRVRSCCDLIGFLSNHDFSFSRRVQSFVNSVAEGNYEVSYFFYCFIQSHGCRSGCCGRYDWSCRWIVLNNLLCMYTAFAIVWVFRVCVIQTSNRFASCIRKKE